MARVPYVKRDDLNPAEQPLYDGIVEPRGGRLAAVFSLLLNAPEMASLVGDVGAYARFRSQIPGDARETVILTTAREIGCAYEFTHHIPLARKEGVRELVIDGIKAGNVRGMIPQESVYVDYAKQVVHNKVNDATYTAVEHLLGRQGAVEVTVLAGYYTMLGLSMMALGVELEEGVENLLP